MGAISMRSSSFVLCGVLALSLSACKSTSGSGAAKEDLALVPKETDIVLMANVVAHAQHGHVAQAARRPRRRSARTRRTTTTSSPSARSIRSSRSTRSSSRSRRAAPPRRSSRRSCAAPSTRASSSQCAKDQAKKDGRDVTVTDYNGKKLYTDNQKAEAWATFLDAKTVVVGGKEWVKKVVDLAAGKGGRAPRTTRRSRRCSSAPRPPTRCGAPGWCRSRRAIRSRTIRACRRRASMKDIFGSVDFASGVPSELNVDTGSEADAKDLAAKATAQLADVRKSPQFMMMGLAQYLDGIKIDSKAATFHVTHQLQLSSRSTTSSIASRVCSRASVARWAACPRLRPIQ